MVNLTAHPINLILGQNSAITIKPSGTRARIETCTIEESKEIEVTEGIVINIPIKGYNDNNIVGLPDPEEGTIYIVSFAVARQARRPDVISPMTDDSALRDAEGNVVGVKYFQKFA